MAPIEADSKSKKASIFFSGGTERCSGNPNCAADWNGLLNHTQIELLALSVGHGGGISRTNNESHSSNAQPVPKKDPESRFQICEVHRVGKLDSLPVPFLTGKSPLSPLPPPNNPRSQPSIQLANLLNPPTKPLDLPKSPIIPQLAHNIAQK
jgi:hypothetical protein